MQTEIPLSPHSSMFGRVLFLSLAVAVAGCGPSGPNLYPVVGKVSLRDGTPVEYGFIILHPEDEKAENPLDVCQGTIKEGKYSIMTDVRQGARAGRYLVSIQAAKDIDPANPYVTEWLADEKYIDPLKSKLKLEVVESPEPGQYDFELDPPARKK